jgi:hypothetical protein
MTQGNGVGSKEYSEKSLLLFEFIDTRQKTLSMERPDMMVLIRERIIGLKKS